MGSPKGFARGAGREWALPVPETKPIWPKGDPRFEGKRSPSRDLEVTPLTARTRAPYAGTMRRILGPVLLAGFLAGAMGSSGAESDGPRFAEVTLRLLTMGEKQPLKEVGAFSSSLPLGKSGSLHRTLSVANETKGTSLALTLGISVTPSLDDGGVLHCVVLSEATPKGSEVFRRAKDMTFSHPGEQVMELFADSSTGTRLALAVSATATEERARDAPRPSPRLPSWCGWNSGMAPSGSSW